MPESEGDQVAFGDSETCERCGEPLADALCLDASIHQVHERLEVKAKPADKPLAEGVPGRGQRKGFSLRRTQAGPGGRRLEARLLVCPRKHQGLPVPTFQSWTLRSSVRHLLLRGD